VSTPFKSFKPFKPFKLPQLTRFGLGMVLLALLLFATVAALLAAASVGRAPGQTAATRTSTPSGPTATPIETTGRVQVWLTTADLAAHLTKQPDLILAPTSGTAPLTIDVDERQVFQQMDGFGGAMTDTSAWLIGTKLNVTERYRLMANLFDPTQGIGISFVRVPMGASDFTVTAPYTYDDLPMGQSDPTLAHFSVNHDTAYIIPMLQQARQINPNIKLLATPWSPPAWMKTSGSLLGGAFLPSADAPLAAYFVKFMQAYAAQGLPIYAITPQNEPGYISDFPTMQWPAAQEAGFVQSYLSPALASAGLYPHVLAYDWNWRDTSYSLAVLGNSGARQHLAGTAYHCYGGDPAIMAAVHAAYPTKDVYETECASALAHVSPIDLIIHSARNWSKTAILWNIALDTSGGPKVGHGCLPCTGIVTVDQHTGDVTYTSDYYQIGHASKFVRPGAYRIASTSYAPGSLEDVAFKNPDGSIAVIVHNSASSARTFMLRWGWQSFTYTLPAGAMATFTWAGLTAPSPYISRAPVPPIGGAGDPLAGLPALANIAASTRRDPMSGIAFA
jgi:glucosylceramidase